jgi:hypothetical protein
LNGQHALSYPPKQFCLWRCVHTRERHLGTLAVTSKLKSARHHWWPVAVSARWTDQNGFVHWVHPNGDVQPLRPSNLAVIRNAHHIKLGKKAGEATAWDRSFEQVFQRADDNFPAVLDWLEGLAREDRLGSALTERFLALNATPEMLSLLVEGMVSLAVRSPMNREASVSLAEHLRGPLPEPERNALISLNIARSQRSIADALGTRGKFVILYSPQQEFIFGDGFFHTLTSEVAAMHYPKMFVPLTPTIAVLYARPTRYLTNPTLTTLVVSQTEATSLNCGTQTYARQMLFYRKQAPLIIDAFRRGEHLRFASHENPVDSIIDSIPGVPPRDRSLDEVFEHIRTTRNPNDQQ